MFSMVFYGQIYTYTLWFLLTLFMNSWMFSSTYIYLFASSLLTCLPQSSCIDYNFEVVCCALNVYLELIYNFKSYVMLVVCKSWYILWIVQEYDVEDSVLPLQPSLNYTAPEYVRSKASSGGCSSDIFSFGCLAYHLIARKPLFNCNNNVKMVCVI